MTTFRIAVLIMIFMPEELEQKRLSFIGLSIHQINSRSELIDYLIKVVDNNFTKVIYGHSLWTISILKQVPNVYYFGEKADLLVSDGRPFYLLAKWHGLPLRFEISIPNLVLLCLDIANQKGWSVFLLGAERSINMTAQQRISKKYPKIGSVTGRDGYFSANEELEVVKTICHYKPNVLLIGMPSPRKEMIAVKWKKEFNSNIIIPCGGMIDVLSGSKKLTPNFIKKLGIAGLYRFFQEPRRLFKKTVFGYMFILFNFFPVYFLNVILLRKKDFSIIEYYR